MGSEKKNDKKIVILASGTGSNAAKIIDYFRESSVANVSLLISNNPNAGALDKAVDRDVPILILDRKEFFSDDSMIKFLKSEHIDLIVLAGFLWLIPEKLIDAFPNKIINVHPALLPKYGGKGMYGMAVHKAVVEAKEKESGITIHYVNKNFDEGEIIFQSKCALSENETPDSLAEKIHYLEHLHFSKVIESILTQQ